MIKNIIAFFILILCMILCGVSAEARTTLSAAKSWYVNPNASPANCNGVTCGAGSDSTGDGSQATPWATQQYGLNWIQNNIDFAGFTVGSQMVLADATYSPPSGSVRVLQCGGPLTGTETLTITGNTTTPSNVKFNVPNSGYGVTAGDYCWLIVQGIDFVGPTTGAGSVYLIASHFGGIDFGKVIFEQNGHDKTSGGIDVFAINGGVIIATDDFSITGGASVIYATQLQGQFSGSATVTIPNAISTLYFAQAISNGLMVGSPGFTYTGAGVAGTTGTRAQAILNAVIDVNGTTTAFPGNAVYSTAFGGQIQ